MKSEQNIKTYHMIILSLFLSSLLILNSNNINKQREQKKITEDKNKFFNKIISNRKLQEPNEPIVQSNSDKVCEKGSKELREYYKTGDMSLIGLKENEGIKYDDKDSKYMKALKLIVKKLVGSDNDENENGSSGGGRRLESFDTETKNAVVDYLMHMIPIIVFLVIGILAIPAWPICCFCCCCNCCCCCCCKKQKCKIPCVVFTYIFYALSVAICIYGISTTNKVFVDIADTECSILKFVDEVLDGEKLKETPPIWAGIEGIQNMLNSLTTTLTDLKDNSLTTLNNKIQGHLDDSEEHKSNFLNALRDAHKKFFTDEDCTNYLADYSYRSSSNEDYVLDIIQKFGKFKDETGDDPITGEPPLSLIFNWTTEFSVISREADNQLEDSKDDLNDILVDSFGDIINALEEGSNKIGDLDGKFDDFKDGFSQKIIDYSGDIDKYGKLGTKLFYGGLGLINIAIAILMLLILFCSGKMCTKCSCCRCICKLFTHILWNILYLLMILTFFIGFIFSFFGQIGSDVMNIVSFIVSEDNLGPNGENLIFDEKPKIKNYVNICVNQDGNIKNELGFDDDMTESLNNVYEAQEQIDQLLEQFKENLNFYTYNNATKKLEDIYLDLSSTEKFGLIKKSNLNMLKEADLKFEEILNVINSAPQTDNQGYNPWDGTCSLTACVANRECNNPKQCDVKGHVSDNLLEKAEIIDKIRKGYDYAQTNSKEDGGYKDTLDNLKTLYGQYLSEYTGILEYVSDIIHSITEIIEEYVGSDGDFFDIINCKFIGKNLKVLLDNLKSALGGNVKTIGICISVVGLSLALSISSTILLIVIINISIDENKKIENQAVPEYPADSAGRVIAYQNN